MDYKAKRKSSFRDRLNDQKKDKRIVSPLVRYNDNNQPVCKVCDIVLKSESFWDVHQVSRKHHEAMSNFKASAAALNAGNKGKPESRKELPKSKHENFEELENTRFENSVASTRPQLSSGLPPNFFDNNDSQKPNTSTQPEHARASTKSQSSSGLPPNFFDDSDSQKANTSTRPEHSRVSTKPQLSGLPPNFFDDSNSQRPITGTETEIMKPAKELTQTSQIAGSEAKQVKGALPEGFFDNKEADLLARGIKPVKPDVKDEYKEFEKLIQEDLQEVDNRMEEEEIDAAEMIEEAESVEQKTYREKVELLRKKKMELKADRSAKRSKGTEGVSARPKLEESSSDDDSDENFAVDWRAQHL
ncbi:protein ABA AND ROS SENSITIVE 1 [Humulus lupulus]|uniref:protein ABA AND ROS SENSITIVE 1 n=1 Tax=Humulus lupulus TaxID=3486 RepID=UPI002B406345|nr:protein ABA AND ROS SENSITIVE 1 [Humulus lupulus]